MDPAGKVAVVTGAASGIGRATAQLLAARGAVVVVADVDAAGAAETVASIAAEGGEASFVALDVSRPEAVEATLREIAASRGAIHVLHNNAGLVTGTPDFPDCSSDRIAALVTVNVLGTLVGTRVAIELMSRTGGGVVVNMSSTLATAAAHPDPVYAATKAAVLHFTRLCAPYATSHGVRVNCILPGGVDTPIIAKTGAGGQPAEWLRERLSDTALLTPGAIAETVLALVEDDTRAGEAIEIRNPG